MKTKHSKFFIYFFLFTLIISAQYKYTLVDTGQKKFYNNTSEITSPVYGESFFGQDAHYSKNEPSYKNNNDGTITDLNTGLMWQKSADQNNDGVINYSDKLYYDDAINSASTLKLAGYSDWRLPTIKELYSLILYSGSDVAPNATSSKNLIPFINTEYFDFGYGDISAGERIIDAQFATSTIYVSTTMNGNKTMFGVNFADGRIKGYPADKSVGKKYYVLFVRGGNNYGVNDFTKNSDGTITDNSTGLMWMKDDNKTAVNWETALSYAENVTYAGYSDWRLPNAKELHSILDYTRSPATTGSAAINPIFNCSQITNEAGENDYPFYWTSTTFCSDLGTKGEKAVYICFGRALGYMNGRWIDVHGAGAQRSDPKSGDPSQYPTGAGPQGDAIRINNYVRLVRDIKTTDIESGNNSELPSDYFLSQNYPNPFNPVTQINFSVPKESYVSLNVYDILGKEVANLVSSKVSPGNHKVSFNASGLQSGVYLYCLRTTDKTITKKSVYLK